MDGLLFIDGRYVRPDDAQISVFETGFRSGIAVFDTFSLFKGCIFRLEDHLDRFFASMKTVRIDNFPYSRSEFRDIILKTVRDSGLRDATVSVYATRGGRGSGPIWTWRPTVIVMCLFQPPVPATLHKEGVRACIASVRSIPGQSLPPEVKHVNRIVNYFAMLDARDKGVDEAILLDADGGVTEGPNFNVFTVHGERIRTPRLGVLRGITRRTMLDIAEHHGYEATEEPLTPYDLYSADEVFICSTNRGAVGVTAIDGRVIGDGKPGSITTKLNDTYWTWRVDSEYVLKIDAPTGETKVVE